jgi:hypothetical protein
LPTANSNSAFGYNFEGALQEYVLVDERVITSPEGESMFIPAPEDLSGSAIALCEPWACVEDAYVEEQRQQLKTDGKCLVVGPDNLLSHMQQKVVRWTGRRSQTIATWGSGSGREPAADVWVDGGGARQ